MVRASILLASVILAACGPPGPPPYGFDREPVQHFVLETEEQTEIDEASVRTIRYAEIALEAHEARAGRTELALRLERYLLRIEGAPGGATELALSREGLVTRAPPHGEVRLGPEEVVPGGRSVRSLLEEPVGGVVVGPDGALLGDPWRSREGTLGDLPVLDWMLLALPVTPSAQTATWIARRPVPPLGQYVLGIEIPTRFERGDGGRIRFAGATRRASLELASGYRGRLAIEHHGETTVEPGGTVREAHLELHAEFDPEQGGKVRSTYRVRVQRRSSENPVNPAPSPSDTPGG